MEEEDNEECGDNDEKFFDSNESFTEFANHTEEMDSSNLKKNNSGAEPNGTTIFQPF